MDVSDRRLRRACWLVTVALALAFLFVAARNIENFRPVSDDDNWIMSASFKLATEGVLGSDLYSGLFNGDRHYFFNLPAFHVAQAAVFAVAGAGPGQARWPSLAAALVIIGTASWLATRWSGPVAGCLTAALLVFWRSNLADLDPGLPMLGLARSGRYDGFAVALVWVSLGLLDWCLGRPRRGTAVLTGLIAGAAALTQFFGVAALMIACALLAPKATRQAAAGLLPWIALGFAAVTLPYAIDAAAHGGDWFGQNVTIRDAGRIALASPAFYFWNLVREPLRYVEMAPAALAVVPALVALARRLVRRPGPQDVMLAAALAVPAIVLALLESTKAALYAAVLLPAICVLVAMAGADLADWLRRSRSPARLAISIVAVIVGIAMLADGAAAYRLDWQQSSAATRYSDVASRIRAVIPAGAAVFGPHRWWWALHDRPYRALHGIWWQWRLARDGGQSARFGNYVVAADVRYVIVNDDVRANAAWLPSPMQDEFWQFINSSCRLASSWSDPTYRSIDIYEVGRR